VRLLALDKSGKKHVCQNCGKDVCREVRHGSVTVSFTEAGVA